MQRGAFLADLLAVSVQSTSPKSPLDSFTVHGTRLFPSRKPATVSKSSRTIKIPFRQYLGPDDTRGKVMEATLRLECSPNYRHVDSGTPSAFAEITTICRVTDVCFGTEFVGTQVPACVVHDLLCQVLLLEVIHPSLAAAGNAGLHTFHVCPVCTTPSLLDQTIHKRDLSMETVQAALQSGALQSQVLVDDALWGMVATRLGWGTRAFLSNNKATENPWSLNVPTFTKQLANIPAVHAPIGGHTLSSPLLSISLNGVTPTALMDVFSIPGTDFKAAFQEQGNATPDDLVTSSASKFTKTLFRAKAASNAKKGVRIDSAPLFASSSLRLLPQGAVKPVSPTSIVETAAIVPLKKSVVTSLITVKGLVPKVSNPYTLPAVAIPFTTTPAAVTPAVPTPTPPTPVVTQVHKSPITHAVPGTYQPPLQPAESSTVEFMKSIYGKGSPLVAASMALVRHLTITVVAPVPYSHHISPPPTTAPQYEQVGYTTDGLQSTLTQLHELTTRISKIGARPTDAVSRALLPGFRRDDKEAQNVRPRPVLVCLHAKHFLRGIRSVPLPSTIDRRSSAEVVERFIAAGGVVWCCTTAHYYLSGHFSTQVGREDEFLQVKLTGSPGERAKGLEGMRVGSTSLVELLTNAHRDSPWVSKEQTAAMTAGDPSDPTLLTGVYRSQLESSGRTAATISLIGRMMCLAATEHMEDAGVALHLPGLSPSSKTQGGMTAVDSALTNVSAALRSDGNTYSKLALLGLVPTEPSPGFRKQFNIASNQQVLCAMYGGVVGTLQTPPNSAQAASAEEFKEVAALAPNDKALSTYTPLPSSLKASEFNLIANTDMGIQLVSILRVQVGIAQGGSKVSNFIQSMRISRVDEACLQAGAQRAPTTLFAADICVDGPVKGSEVVLPDAIRAVGSAPGKYVVNQGSPKGGLRTVLVLVDGPVSNIGVLRYAGAISAIRARCQKEMGSKKSLDTAVVVVSESEFINATTPLPPTSPKPVAKSTGLGFASLGNTASTTPFNRPSSTSLKNTLLTIGTIWKCKTYEALGKRIQADIGGPSDGLRGGLRCLVRATSQPTTSVTGLTTYLPLKRRAQLLQSSGVLNATIGASATQGNALKYAANEAAVTAFLDSFTSYFMYLYRLHESLNEKGSAVEDPIDDHTDLFEEAMEGELDDGALEAPFVPTTTNKMPPAQRAKSIAARMLTIQQIIKGLKGLLAYRQLEKVRLWVAPKTGQLIKHSRVQPGLSVATVHSSYIHTATATGRLACKDPNLQNIPKTTLEGLADGDEGFSLRTLFGSRYSTGKVHGTIIEIDYSQLEPVTLALLSGDRVLVDELNNGIDQHCKRVSLQMKRPYEEVYRLCKVERVPSFIEMRQSMKTFSFQRQYGAGATTIAASTGMSIQKVKEMIHIETQLYSGVEQLHALVTDCASPKGATIKNTVRATWMQPKEVKFLHSLEAEGGVFPTPTGTKYRFYDGVSSTKIKNHPTQGLAAELVQVAVAMCYLYLLDAAADEKRAAVRPLMINTVHDSIWLDVPPCTTEEQTALQKGMLTDLTAILESVISVFVGTFSSPAGTKLVNGSLTPVTIRVEASQGASLATMTTK